MWSSATFVSTTTRVPSTFVASCRPPSPASTTATSTPASANASERSRGQRLELRRAEPSACGRTRCDRALEVRLGAADADPLAPAAHVRREIGADGEAGVGEQRLGQARRRRLAVRADDVHRRIARAADRRARASSARIRSSPKPSVGHGLSDATQSVADRVKLAPVALELLALGLDDVRRRRARRTVSFASIASARAISCSSRATSSSRSAPLPLRALGPHDGLEDAHLVAFERRRARRCAGIAPPPPARARARPPSPAYARVGLRPRRDDQPRRARGQVRPDLLGDVRHHRMQQLEQPLERGERGRLHVGLAEPRLDRLEVPVAEVVEGQVVEPVDGVREVVARRGPPRSPPASRRCARGSTAPRATTAAASTVRRRPRAAARLAFQSLFASRRPSSIGSRREAHVLRRRHLQQAVARRVGAVRVDQLDRVDAVAELLRHPASVGGEDRRVDDHVAERDVADAARARP